MKIIHRVEDIQAADRFAIEHGTSAIELMGRAAKGIYDCYAWHGSTLIVVGKGNNGGDGYALAVLLKEAGHSVSIMELDSTRTDTSEYYFSKCLELSISISPFNKDNLSSFDVIVDCIFGVGFKGELTGKYKDAVESINASNKYVISIDANSGLNLRNGNTNLAIKSDLTISISNLKPGYYLNCGKDYVGEIKEVDIGLNTNGPKCYLLDKEDIKHIFKPRNNMSNKGDYGYVGIMGGCQNYPGAVKLANLGQTPLYAGAGVTRVIVPDCLKDILYPHVLEATIFPIPSNNGYMEFDIESIDKALNHLKAVSIGMGWGTSDSNIEILKYVLENKELIVVIDADGLNALSRLDLDILNKTRCQVVLTPHIKEFSRLLKCPLVDIIDDPIAKAEEFVSKYNVVLLLKGPTTIVASREHTYLVDRGCPGMATAGSGDVLSGILSGILGYSRESLDLGVASAAYINGLAGEIAQSEYGDIGMVSSDTARCVSKAIKKIQE
ncbi:MAG: NAD(P)H-hydrate dehydratase [Bacilli bacterium]|nr:NAD(P)H-hydrate dehydratase [Bacilli bacterium]